MSAPSPTQPAGVSEAPAKKSAKEMTKAERRAVQEAQRAAKAAQKGGGGGGSGAGAPKAASKSAAAPDSASSPAAPAHAKSNQATSATPAAGTSSKRAAMAAPASAADASGAAHSAMLFGNVAGPRRADAVSAAYRGTVHPAIVRLGLQFSEFIIVGANARCIATLEAFKEVIRSYRTPAGTTLSRDLMMHISPQVSHLVAARPMSVSMGNAIRYLKYEISVLGIDLDEEEAKEHLCERIDHFIRDRITYAGRVLQGHATAKIKDGDVVLTYSRSSVVEGVLLAAHRQGTKFHVIVVDSRPLLEGKRLLCVLVAAGIPCSYGLISALGALMPRASVVLLGTHALLANGALYSRAGTAACAMMARERGAPVIVCCETYKFSDRVQLDSFVTNEAGNPADLIASAPPDCNGASSGSTSTGALADWRSIPSLGVVNLLYDVTPPRYVSAVASEVGLSGPESVGVILRDYKSVLYGV